MKKSTLIFCSAILVIGVLTSGCVKERIVYTQAMTTNTIESMSDDKVLMKIFEYLYSQAKSVSAKQYVNDFFGATPVSFTKSWSVVSAAEIFGGDWRAWRVTWDVDPDPLIPVKYGGGVWRDSMWLVYWDDGRVVAGPGGALQLDIDILRLNSGVTITSSP